MGNNINSKKDTHDLGKVKSQFMLLNIKAKIHFKDTNVRIS